MASFQLVSWNVNGLRSVANKGFLTWLASTPADVVGLQEVRAEHAVLSEEVRAPAGWHTHFVAAERKGYSGVGLYARMPPDDVTTTLDHPPFDVEGRLIFARFGKLLVVNCYFPNGKGTERDNSRVPHKLAFYRKLFEKLEPLLKKGERIVVMGDFNTAHHEIDLARPKDNTKISGFLPEEREELTRWMKAGWVDSFRRFEEGPGHYSWWSARPGTRARNIGWRLDYQLVSPGAAEFLKSASIEHQVMGSDHCPVTAVFDRRVLK